MLIFPAIDLRNGRVVRLRQGRAEAETVYGDDPSAVAARWQGEGGEWLHVVNLDGAFGTSATANLKALAGILETVSIPVQFGGGLRDLESIRRILEMGVRRAVLGTAAIEDPGLVSQAIALVGPERIAIGIDARQGLVATHGWQAQSTVPALDLAVQMAERGIAHIIYTDIARDGMLGGIDADAIAALALGVRAHAKSLRVIASGGVARLSDIQALHEREQDGIEGVIIGQALYTGAIDLREALCRARAYR